MPITAAGPMPDELADAAAERDLLVDEVADTIIPPASTPYNAKALDALASAVASLGGIMGVDIEIEPYDGPTTELDPDLQRFLLMMDSAARDYGKPFPVALTELRSDQELTAITAHLMALAEDDAFAEYLSAEEEPVEVAVDVEVGPAVEEEADDAFFAGRI